MLNIFKAALATLVVVLAGSILVAPTQAATPLKILVSGDSRTQGFPGDATWRFHFDRNIVRSHNLVGSRCDTRLGTCGDYADTNFDRDHFAKSGTTWGFQHTVIANEIANQNPDVVYLELGVNDLRAGGDSGSGPVYGGTTVKRMIEWINAVRSVDSSVPIIIAEVLPVNQAVDGSYPLNGTTTNSRIADFNTKAKAEVAGRSNVNWVSGSVVPNWSWNPKTMTRDGLHPNGDGERYMARRALNAFDALGYNLT